MNAANVNRGVVTPILMALVMLGLLVSLIMLGIEQYRWRSECERLGGVPYLGAQWGSKGICVANERVIRVPK